MPRCPVLLFAAFALLGAVLPAIASPQAPAAASSSAAQGRVARPTATAAPTGTPRPASSPQASSTGVARPSSAGAAPAQTPAAGADGHADGHVHGNENGQAVSDDHHGPNDINAAFGTPFALQGGNVVIGAAFPNGFEVSFASPQATAMTVSQKSPASTNFPPGWRAFEKESYLISMTPAAQTTRSALFLHFDPALVKGSDIAIATFSSANQSWAVMRPPAVNAKFGRIEQPVAALQGEFLSLVKADAVAPTEAEAKAASGRASSSAPGWLLRASAASLAMLTVL